VNILVIEDDLALRYFQKAVFEQDGYTVQLAASGEEALLLIAAVRPDIVFLDVMLKGGGLQGGAFVDRFRAAGFPSTPVIAVTAFSDALSIAYRGRFDQVVDKPVSAGQLLALVQAYAV